MTQITLTANEAAVLKNVHSFQYMDDGISTMAVHADSFAEDVEVTCGVGPESVGGIVASLCKKGFFTKGADDTVWINNLAREYNRQLNAES